MDIDVVDIDHVAIRVSDLERALSFYHDLLGLPIRDRDRYDAGEVPYVAVVAGSKHIHLVPTEDETIDVGGEHICLLIRSNDVESREELTALLDHLRKHDFRSKTVSPTSGTAPTVGRGPPTFATLTTGVLSSRSTDAAQGITERHSLAVLADDPVVFRRSPIEFGDSFTPFVKWPLPRPAYEWT